MCLTLPWAALWRSELEAVAHLVGIVGFALIILALVYSLRKRRLLIRQGSMRRWLLLHHWAGLFGGLLALVHSLGNMRGLGLPLVAVLLLVLASSGIYLVERRLRRPLSEANARARDVKAERDRLDSMYRRMYASGHAGTQEGRDTYERLMRAIDSVQQADVECDLARERCPNLAWWKHLHNVGTMVLVGLVLVHIWAKLYFLPGGA